MPKRISKSKNVQIATQKQIVNVIVGKGKGKRSASKKRIDTPLLNTGPELSTQLFVRGSIPPASKYDSFTRGRVSQIFTPTEDAPRKIRSYPDPRPSPPGQEPQAYDYGEFETLPPTPFNENMLRRLPVKLEEIPIPQQGLYTQSVRPSMDASGPSLTDSQYMMGDPIFRMMDNMMNTPSVKSEDKYMPKNSPYEDAEFK